MFKNFSFIFFFSREACVSLSVCFRYRLRYSIICLGEGRNSDKELVPRTPSREPSTPAHPPPSLHEKIRPGATCGPARNWKEILKMQFWKIKLTAPTGSIFDRSKACSNNFGYPSSAFLFLLVRFPATKQGGGYQRFAHHVSCSNFSHPCENPGARPFEQW